MVAIDALNHGDRPRDESFLRTVAGNRDRAQAGEDAAPLFAALHTLLADQIVPEWTAVPLQFLIQWDDEQLSRDQSLALFDALASPIKTLHANAGKHGEVPEFETEDSLRFFARHLA